MLAFPTIITTLASFQFDFLPRYVSTNDKRESRKIGRYPFFLSIYTTYLGYKQVQYCFQKVVPHNELHRNYVPACLYAHIVMETYNAMKHLANMYPGVLYQSSAF